MPDGSAARADALVELGRRLELAMRGSSFTYRALAEQSGVSRTALHNLVRHRRTAPDRYVLKVVVRTLGLDWDAGWEDLWRRAVESGSEPPEAVAPVPEQLPPDIAAFTGRQAELAALDGLCGGGGPVPIALLTGAPGVGKTALAVRWAHHVREHFPDGQLYADLRGHDPDEPVPADRVLAGFLHAFGVPDGRIPLGTDDRAAELRTLLSGRRVLVVLDNAASAEQVRPLTLISHDAEFARRRRRNTIGQHLWLRCLEPRAASVLSLHLGEVVDVLERMSDVVIEVRPESVTIAPPRWD